jgi:hypothetical protein
MSTILHEPRTKEPQVVVPADRQRRPATLPDGRPDLSLLEDKLPDWLKAPKALAALTFVVGLVYFLFARMDVRVTDVWGHLAYGRWMVEHGALPATEPLLALAQGVPWVDTAWLSKVAGYWVFEQFGVAGLQFIHAASIATGCALLAWALCRRTGSAGWTTLGLLACLLVDWQQLEIHRPQDAGLACFVAVFVAASSLRRHRAMWVAIPLVFALWANLHGSFPMGLLLLATIAAGRAIDLFRRTGRLGLTLRSRLVWQPLLLLQLSAAAALLNPAGLGIYSDVLTISSNPNLKTLLDWVPLNLRMFQGQAFALIVVALCAVYRWSPRRVSAAEVLLLVGFGALSLWTLRMIVWWGPIAGYYLALHAQAGWRSRHRLPVVAPPAERRGLWTIATVGLVWIFFAYSPFGMQRVHGMPEGDAVAKEFRAAVVERTPLDAVTYLTEHAGELPGGPMYNSQEWGDYLLWAAPPKFQVFVNSHAHLVPREVWDDFLLVHDGGGGWDDKLDRYGVNTVLVDTSNYDGLIRALREQGEKWQEAFRDPQGLAVLFVRRKPV